MRGPSEGLHEDPALGRGGRGKGATPQPVAGPRGRDRHAAPPPWLSGGSARGPEGPPHSPPPLPLRPKSGQRQAKETAAVHPPLKRPLHPGCGGTTAEAGARTPCPPPADGAPGGPRTAQTERPYQRLARGRRGRERGQGGSPPLPPPPPRPTGQSAALHTALQRPQTPAPAGVAAAGRAHTSVQEQRAHQAWGRRTAAHQNSMEAAPYMTFP